MLWFAPAQALRINYFAYGSNLARQVLQERRNIQPLGQCRGYVTDYRLAFNLGGMAGAENSPGDVLHGVVYSLTPPDWLRLCATEAVPFIYSTEPVRVRLYDQADAARCASYGFQVLEENVVEAYTLQVTNGPWRRDGQPSKRYADLLRSGARQNRLDEDWIAALNALDHRG